MLLSCLVSCDCGPQADLSERIPSRSGCRLIDLCKANGVVSLFDAEPAHPFGAVCLAVRMEPRPARSFVHSDGGVNKSRLANGRLSGGGDADHFLSHSGRGILIPRARRSMARLFQSQPAFVASQGVNLPALEPILMLTVTERPPKWLLQHVERAADSPAVHGPQRVKGAAASTCV